MTFNTESSRKKTRSIRWIFTVCILLCHGIYAFQLSMVASRAPLSGKTMGQNAASIAQRVQPAPKSNSVTSALISQLAVAALKLRLKTQTHVSCDVSATSSNILLRGQVGPVTVRGRGWGSNLGLTCRVIEATVEQCELDMGRVLSNQKLVLSVPAEGRAMVALNKIDFGNFITHPLMKPPGLANADRDATEKLEFIKEDVSINPKDGTVTFFGKYLDSTWRFTLQRGSDEGKKAVINVAPHYISNGNEIDSTAVASELTKVTSNFFNQMVFELDGTYLTFGDMMLTDKGKEDIIMLSLGITVKKFPSPGLDF